MGFDELILVLHELPREDKLRAVQILTADLAQEEPGTLVSGKEYPIFTPYDCYEAAEILEKYLKEHTKKN